MNIVTKKIYLCLYCLVNVHALFIACSCCDCDDQLEDTLENSLESALIYEDDKTLKQSVLEHLKLDGEKLNNIVTDINNISDHVKKIEKIIEYSKDINWSNPTCPNTLIKWEKNSCVCVAYLHMMLNNPYFVKFFLILDKIKSLHKHDTYMLKALCDTMRWCVERPSFNTNNLGSIDNIMRALFLKKKSFCAGDNYFYCKKEKKAIPEDPIFLNRLEHYYYNPEEKETRKYNSSQDYHLFEMIITCLVLDLNIQDNDDIKQIIMGITFPKNAVCLEEAVISDIFPNEKQEAKITTNSKLLGLYLYQEKFHLYTIVNYNGDWYNKNTLHINNCGKQDKKTLKDLLKNIQTIEKPQYKDYNRTSSRFQYLKIFKTQSSTCGLIDT